MIKCYVAKVFHVKYHSISSLAGKKETIADIINSADGWISDDQNSMEIDRHVLLDMKSDMDLHPKKWKEKYKLNDEDYEELISSVSMWIKESDPNNEFVRLEWI